MRSDRIRDPRLLLPAIFAGIVLSLVAAPPAGSLSQLRGAGQVSGSLSLSSDPAGFAAEISSSTTGATVASGADGSQSIDFGDLTLGKGEPVTAVVRFRIRGNAPYTLNMSETGFNASGLQWKDRDVSGSADRGSFITVSVGELKGAGPLANLGQTTVNQGLKAGTPLSDVSQGQVGADSTTICSGSAPSLGGGPTTPDNAIDVPVSFSVPTGFEIGPLPGVAQGRFAATVTVGIFLGGH